MQNKKDDFIVIVTAVPFPYGNASDNAIFTFMDGFQEHGCRGEVLCMAPNSPYEHKDIPPIGEYKGVKYRYIHNKVRINSSFFSRLKINKYVTRYLFKKYLKEKSMHYNVKALFVTHVGKLFYDFTQICKTFNVEVVLVSCEYPEYLAESYNERLGHFRFYSKNINKYIFETETLKDYYKKALGKDLNSIVIPATMPFEDILNCTRKENIPCIAYCGSIHSEAKDGLSNIIKAFALFHTKNPTVVLKFVGRIAQKDYYKELLNLIEILSLNECVFFTGEVTREEYVHHLKESSMMVVAKPKNSYYGGGLSSKVIEYLFSGRAVLMVDSDDYVNYLTHLENVYFVSDNNAETLSKAMLYLFEHPNLMKKMGENGQRFAMENFNYHKLTKKLLKFLVENDE